MNTHRRFRRGLGNHNQNYGHEQIPVNYVHWVDGMNEYSGNRRVRSGSGNQC